MSKELIKITTNDKCEQLVSGRELHEGLKIEKAFSTWIQTQLENVDAVENVDFTTIWSDSFKEVVEFNGNVNSMTAKGYSVDYILTIDIAKEICMCVGVAPRTNEETKKLSKEYRKYFIECEKKLKEIDPRANLLLAIYNGGEAGVLASKQLTELEVQKATKPLIEEIEHKEDVIIGLVDEIDVADKRQILNRVVKHKTTNYQQRWNALYREFDNKYHVDSKRRYENYKASGEKPKVTGRLDYIDKVMNMIPQLYEIACKLYKSDIEELVQEMYDLRK